MLHYSAEIDRDLTRFTSFFCVITWLAFEVVITEYIVLACETLISLSINTLIDTIEKDTKIRQYFTRAR